MGTPKQKTNLCILRDVFRSIREYEILFQEKYDLCLNEGMTICSLSVGMLSSSDLADKLGLSASNMSKVVKAVEDKKLVKRMLGEDDRRQMYFMLTKKGEERLLLIKEEEQVIEQILHSIYKQEEVVISKT